MPAKRPLNQDDYKSTISQDLKTIYHPESSDGVLTLEGALARAIRYSLDAKVAETNEIVAADEVPLAALNALPSMSAKIQRVGRSNRGGSSSLSLLTNTQSLQPSISSEQFRVTEQLNVNWNILDAGMNIARARSASDRELVARERRRKAFHDVVQDTYSVYWRAAAAQRAMPLIDDLLVQSQDRLKKIDQAIAAGIVPLGDARAGKARLIDKRQQLMQLRENMLLSEVSLKVMINLPPGSPVRLDLGGENWLSADNLPRIGGDIADFETMALMHRPEVHEGILNKRISTRNIKFSIFETFPGAEIVLGLNADSNKFLANKSWIDESIGLTQNLTKILTAKYRYTSARNEDLLEDRRRQALVAAVMTQVHVSKARFDYLTDYYGTAKETDDNNRQMLDRAASFEKAGMMGAPEVIAARMDAGISSINRMLAYASAQEAYGQFLNTVGVDLWGDETAGMTVPELAQELKKKLAEFETVVIGKDMPGGKAAVPRL